MSAVLGFMMMTAVVTARKGRTTDPVDPEQQRRLDEGSWDQREEIKRLTDEVSKLQQSKTVLETALSGKNVTSRVLNEQLQELKMFALLTEIEGPGVIVTLRDGVQKEGQFDDRKVLIDEDVLRIINELWNSAAEAIAVNGVRISARSNIRVTNSDVVVDGQESPKPIVIEAVGNDVVRKGLALPGGPVEMLQRQDPFMAKVENALHLKLPAYNGPTEFKIGKLPKETKK